MSLIDVAEELEYVPEQELINLSQNPQSRFPQFLVLSEVQRRNQMRRMYENQVNKAEQPLTTVAEEKVMELAQSSAMPNVPSPMSNETNQSPRGLLGMASGRSTSKETLEEASDELRRTSKAEKRFGDFSDAVVNAVKLGTMDRETAERLLLGNSELFLDASRNKEFLPYYGNMPRPFGTKEGLRDIIKKSRNEMRQRQLGLESGGLVSLQQGRTTDYQENIERSLQPAQGGQRGVPSGDPRLQNPIFAQVEQPIIGSNKSRARQTKIFTPEIKLEEEVINSTNGKQFNITKTPPPKEKVEEPNVLQQIFDTSGQLGLPKVEIPRMTEEEKQRELGIYALGIMADAFGTGKNIGEAGSKLGKGVQGLLDIKRTQRQDDIKADSATRAQSVEEITLANTLYKTQLLADQYRKQGETNKVKALEILQEEIKEIKESTLGLSDETTKERIEKLQAQLDAELNRMFGTEALATYPGM
tara:strand:- start:3091 stop:4509 length:1419 start_codon:yes stop_codon:yes gene_type:complete